VAAVYVNAKERAAAENPNENRKIKKGSRRILKRNAVKARLAEKSANTLR